MELVSRRWKYKCTKPDTDINSTHGPLNKLGFFFLYIITSVSADMYIGNFPKDEE